MCGVLPPVCVDSDDLGFLSALASEHYALMVLDMTRRLSVAEDERLAAIEREMSVAIKDRFGVSRGGVRCQIDPIYHPASGTGPAVIYCDDIGNTWRRPVPRNGDDTMSVKQQQQGVRDQWIAVMSF